MFLKGGTQMARTKTAPWDYEKRPPTSAEIQANIDYWENRPKATPEEIAELTALDPVWMAKFHETDQHTVRCFIKIIKKRKEEATQCQQPVN
jgi:hypothetical protein